MQVEQKPLKCTQNYQISSQKKKRREQDWGKKNKRQLNSALLVRLIKENIIEGEEVSVVVEQVNAMPGQGVTSMFNFGQTFGAIKGVCAALELPIFFVRPSKWKKHFELINSSKDASRTKAIEMYPKLSNQLAKKKKTLTSLMQF